MESNMKKSLNIYLKLSITAFLVITIVQITSHESSCVVENQKPKSKYESHWDNPLFTSLFYSQNSHNPETINIRNTAID